ncbi:MAG: hypothetical protein KA004_07035 [Verrucomicrobiales bacterium]|nr:hypothetical protein [Verrucomicrobiales bacterium]
MFTFTQDSNSTGLEDAPLVKKGLSACPMPTSSQGGYPLTHYGVLKGPGLYVAALVAVLTAQYLLLAKLFIPVTKVPPIFTAWLMLGGVVGAWCCHFGSGLRRRTKTKAANVSQAEAAALSTRFPFHVRLCNALGILLLTGLVGYEISLWLHGTARANLLTVVIPPTVVGGVALAWVGIAVMHWVFSGAALWILAVTWLRGHDIWRNRRANPLSSAPLYVHGWRKSKITTGVELTFAYAHRHCVVPQGRDGDQFVSWVFTIGNFHGDHIAELCHDEINPEQKFALAKALELLVIDLMDQPPVGADAAIPESEVYDAVATHAQTSNANTAAIARAVAGDPKVIAVFQRSHPPQAAA